MIIYWLMYVLPFVTHTGSLESGLENLLVDVYYAVCYAYSVFRKCSGLDYLLVDYVLPLVPHTGSLVSGLDNLLVDVCSAVCYAYMVFRKWI